MKIKPSDIPTYKINGEIYSILTSFCTNDEKEAKTAFARLYEMLKYYVLEFGVSFLVGLSNTDSHTANKVNKKRRGNPKIEVKGRKIPYHAHVVVVGEKAKQFAKKIVKHRNKADGVKLTKSKKVKGYGSPSELELYDDKGIGIINYVYKQSTATMSFSENGFNFKNFESNYYRVEQD